MPTILAAEGDLSPPHPLPPAAPPAASIRIPNGFQTDFKRQNPRKSALQTDQTDKAISLSKRHPAGALREAIAAIEAACLTQRPASTRVSIETGLREIDETLGGGLMRGTVHELLPKSAQDLTAAVGFAFGLAARAQTKAGHTLYIQHDFTHGEYGKPYLPGLAHAGIDPSALIYLHVPRAEDVVWAMGEALKCRGFATVIAEFPANVRVLDLTMTRRLALAAQEGLGLGLILRHAGGIEPNAATTRWLVSSARSTPDAFGGLGHPAFNLELVKNRFGQCGQWQVEWKSHERIFATPPLPRSLARSFADRPDRTHTLAQTA